MPETLKTTFDNRTDDMVALTRDLAAIESPTDDRNAVNHVGAHVLTELERLGADIKIYHREEVGDIVCGTFGAGKPGKPLLVISHMDTVHPIGAIAANPIRIDGDRLYGPGTYDMKASIAVTVAAIEALQELGQMPDRPVLALMTTDEETGSFHSRDLIQELARKSALALIMEAALQDGSLKTWRKSVGRFNVRVQGIASHAGGAHEMGCNAIEEMAHQILKLQRMTDYKIGTTVNAGVISGGTKSNVVPDVCELEVDIRALTDEEMERITNEVLNLQPVMPGAQVSVEGGFDRPPMENDATMQATFQQAKEIAAKYGLTLRASGTGGASDGNYTAATGTPTLDGLGPVGDGAHSERENIIIEDLPRRALLLAALLKDWPVG